MLQFPKKGQWKREVGQAAHKLWFLYFLECRGGQLVPVTISQLVLVSTQVEMHHAAEAELALSLTQQGVAQATQSGRLLLCWPFLGTPLLVCSCCEHLEIIVIPA